MSVRCLWCGTESLISSLSIVLLYTKSDGLFCGGFLFYFLPSVLLFTREECVDFMVYQLTKTQVVLNSSMAFSASHVRAPLSSLT